MPVPEAADVAELNRQILAACQQDERRLIAGREQTVGAGLLIEREHLLPLVTEGVDLAQTSFPTVNGLGLRQGADQHLLGAVAGGHAGASESVRRASSSCGTKAAAWRGTSAVTGASNRSSIWSITWMCCIASPARWRDRSRWSRERQAGLVAGELRPDLGGADASVTASRAAPGR